MAKRSSSCPSKKKASAKAAKEKAAKKKLKQKAATSAASGVAPDHGRQRSAKAAAKTTRIKRTGLESRVRGHVSGRGKRAQARRDSKN